VTPSGFCAAATEGRVCWNPLVCCLVALVYVELCRMAMRFLGAAKAGAAPLAALGAAALFSTAHASDDVLHAPEYPWGWKKFFKSYDAKA
jgi:hypothetical protein